MGQDLRKLFETERHKEFRMKAGHEMRFLHRLEKEMPPGKHRNRMWIWSMAAAIAVVFGLGIYFLGSGAEEQSLENSLVTSEEKDAGETISLGDLSPDLQKVENYYMANINLELAQLKVSPENKGLVDSYMEQLEELNKAYTRLNSELNTFGPNDQTISALIKNLQLRLQLLLKLKEKLNQIKSSKNEQLSSNHV